MNRLVFLSIVVVTTLAGEVDRRECEKLFDVQSTRCCKVTSEILDNLMKKEELKACFQIDMNPVSCEHDRCIAKNRGLITDDDKLDRKKLEEDLTKDFGKNADLLNEIKSNCINGDLDKYGSAEFCEFFKMKQCISVHMFKHCPEWNDNDVCNTFKDLVQECVKTIF